MIVVVADVACDVKSLQFQVSPSQMPQSLSLVPYLVFLRSHNGSYEANLLPALFIYQFVLEVYIPF